jgi:hypothetical protein
MSTKKKPVPKTPKQIREAAIRECIDLLRQHCDYYGVNLLTDHLA